ncbi:MAG TPA: hypothetical protein EYN31_01555, partial [Candidatus Marinimicrobia bacterium]|nr:hypothetical protein [Candidatus Neomarinimicrobiota bacterium]
MEGVIGVGKTSLAHLLEERLNAKLVMEKFDENPFLADFYLDPERYAFQKFGAPTSTKDGVTVAKEIELENNLENMGAQMLREVASKTSDVAGDGTTTATIFAQAIIREGMKNVTAGANPMEIKRGIDAAVRVV